MSKRPPIIIGAQEDSLREAFGKALVKIAPEYPDFVVLDADVAGGTGTHHFRKAYPERFYQCGIAEQNMMAMAGGMAATGLIPVVTSFAVFMLRAVEQARLSIAYPRMNVKLVASHPGLDVGPDGASAQCLEDLAVFRAIPGMVVLSPCDPFEIELATRAIIEYDGPVYMRSGRSPTVNILKKDHTFKIGRGSILREGSDVSIIGCGVTTARALQSASELQEEGISARVVNMSSIKPIDREMILRCAEETRGIVTAEDHNIFGGLGSAVAEVLVQANPVPMEFVGVRDSFGESGEPPELAHKYGIDHAGITNAVKKLLNRIP